VVVMLTQPVLLVKRNDRGALFSCGGSGDGPTKEILRLTKLKSCGHSSGRMRSATYQREKFAGRHARTLLHRLALGMDILSHCGVTRYLQSIRNIKISGSPDLRFATSDAFLRCV
jgi:hypothetical protein